MSMIQCDDCGRIFDSDEDPDCFVSERGSILAGVLCESCRQPTASDLRETDDYEKSEQAGRELEERRIRDRGEGPK